MNILAIDTACPILSAAVSCKEKLYYSELQAGVKQTELVMDCIDALIKKADLKPCDLEGIICMGGPGSFTGLRIGFSVAKGLSLSLSIPFMPYPTLDCIAFPFHNSAMTLAVIESSKNAWFYAFYEGGKSVKTAAEAESAKIAEEIEKIEPKSIILTGSGAESLYKTLPEKPKKGLSFVNEKRGYAKELIAIAKKEKLLDNYNAANIFSGPEYIKKAV